jgi:hypothetical protein
LELELDAPHDTTAYLSVAVVDRAQLDELAEADEVGDVKVGDQLRWLEQEWDLERRQLSDDPPDYVRERQESK